MSSLKRLCVAALLSVVGCSGNGLTTSVAPVHAGSPAAPQARTAVTVKIHIPAPPKSATSRHRAYISPYTSYVLVSQTDSTFATELTQVGTDVSQGANACVSDGSGARTCTVVIDATPPASDSQTDYFEFDTYSAAQTPAAYGTSLINAVPTAERLGSARTSATITVDAANTVNVAIDGVIASYSIVPSTISGDGSQPLAGSYAIAALDASGDTIVAGSTDPYTDGTNYPLSFTESDSPMVSAGSPYTAGEFLSLTESGPDTSYQESTDALGASYTPNTSVQSFYDTITFNATNSLLPSESALFAPIFVDLTSANAGSNPTTGSTNGNAPTFSQNDTNAAGDASTSVSRRAKAHRQTATSNGNNYPIASFTAAGQNVVVAPFEYVGSGTAAAFTATLSNGCSGSDPVIGISPSSGTAKSFTITATTTPSGGYSATSPSGLPITSCYVTFTDANGNLALLEIMNTQSGGTRIGINTPTLLASNFTTSTVDEFDASGSTIGPDTLASFTSANADGIAQDGSHDIFVGNVSGGVTEYAASAYTSSSSVSSIANPTGLAYHATGASAPSTTAELAVASSSGTVTLLDESAGANSAVLDTITLPAGAQAASASGVAWDVNGDLYVADLANGFVYEYTASAISMSESSATNAKVSRKISLPTGAAPEGIAVDGEHNLFVADSSVGAIYVYSATNNSKTPTSTVTDGTGACTAYYGVAVLSGTSDTLYASCTAGNQGVQMLSIPQSSMNMTYTTSATMAGIKPDWLSL